MDPALIAPLISAASQQSSNFTGMINNHLMLSRQIKHQEDAQRLQNEANMALTQEYNKAQRELAQSQNEYNTQMWEKQNAYNSPEATMQRLTEAGINPRAYQQIGQFANAGTPPPAVTPEQKMAEYTEPKLASKELRMQRLAINNAYTEQKIRAVELSSQLYESYKKREEQKRHNIALETLGEWNYNEKSRHNIVTEGIQQGANSLNTQKFMFELRKLGINPHYNESTGSFSFAVPEWLIEATQQEKENYVSELKYKAQKAEEEYNYLIKKGDIEQAKNKRAWIDTLTNVIGKLIDIIL